MAEPLHPIEGEALILRAAMTPSTQRLVLALAALVALLLALAGVGLFAAFKKPDPEVLGAVLGIIGTVLGGAVTLAFHSFFRNVGDASHG